MFKQSRFYLLLVLFIIFLAAIAGCKQLAPVSDDRLPFSDQILYGTLDNGLQYYIRANDLPQDKVELRLNVRSGSLNETEQELGLAHFVEHMAFNGTTNFKGNDLIKFMEESGLTFGQHSNAYTSTDNTNYQLSVPAGNKKLLETSFSILRDWADGITFAPAEIEKEKGVITEEWRNRNGARYRMSILSRDYMMAGSLYPKRDPIGDMTVVASADRDLLKGYYDKWYTPANMSVIVVGNIDPKQIEQEIIKHFSSMQNRNTPTPADKTVPVTKGLRVAVISDPEATSTGVGLTYFYPEGPVTTYRQLKQLTLEQGAMSMLKSRVEAMRLESRTDLMNFFAYKSSGSENNISMARFYIVSDPDTIDADIKAMLVEIERAKRFGFTPEELNEYITTQKTFLDRAASPDYKYPSDSYAGSIAHYDTSGGYLTEFSQDKELQDRIFAETTLADYDKAFKKLLSSGSALVLITVPERDKDNISIDAAKFAAIQKDVSRMKLEAEAGVVPLDALVDQIPAGGAVKSTQRYDNVGGVLVTYENGARLFIKDNKIDRNRFALSARKEGGLSTMNDHDALYAALIPSVLSVSGFDGISWRQLQLYMADKKASVSPAATEYTFDFSGDGDSEDIETAFQLLYRYFTSATADKAAYDAFIKTYETSLKNAEQDKQTIFSRQATGKMYNSAYRRDYLLTSDIPNIDEKQVLELYKKNFLNPTAYIVVIAGDVDPQRVIELGRIYLGGFKPSDAKTKAIYRGVKLKKDFDRYEGYGDVEQRASVGIRLDKDVKAVGNGEYLAMLTRRVLSQRLRETVREDMGSVYGVNAGMGYTGFPEASFFGRISFTCEPSRKDEVINAVTKILNDIAENGVTERELEIAKNQQTLAYDNAGEENSYWANTISYDFIKGEPVLSIDETKALINGLTLRQVNSFAKEYMKNMRIFISVYNPAKQPEKQAN